MDDSCKFGYFFAIRTAGAENSNFVYIIFLSVRIERRPMRRLRGWFGAQAPMGKIMGADCWAPTEICFSVS